MDYVKIEKTKETLKSLKIRWANMLKNLLNQENNNFTSGLALEVVEYICHATTIILALKEPKHEITSTVYR